MKTVNHTVSRCEMLTQRDYKQCHVNVIRIVDLRLCEKFGLQKSEKWYKHDSEPVTENYQVKQLFDIKIQL